METHRSIVIVPSRTIDKFHEPAAETQAYEQRLLCLLLMLQAPDLQVVYVTVDPEVDTAAQMKRWLTAFDPSFVGGTGTEAQLAAVRKAYGVAAAPVAGPDGSYSHSSYVYLIDRHGKLRALMPFGRGADDYVHDVRLLLAGP